MRGLHRRLATAGDFASIASITNHYIRTTAIHFGTEPVTADELRESWRQYEARYAWVVGEHGGEVVAYAKASSWRSRAAYQWTAETGVYVREDRRGHGFGRAVYGPLLAVCRAQGFRSLIAAVTLPNEASAKLHHELGFAAVGVVHHAGWKLHAWWDVGFYQLSLGGPEPATPLRSPADVWSAATASPA